MYVQLYILATVCVPITIVKGGWVCVDADGQKEARTLWINRWSYMKGKRSDRICVSDVKMSKSRQNKYGKYVKERVM
jgi:hypothetical protein